ncbi:MAG: FGGY-family carbohydrate kinase [Inquilinaceae bacterium]
MTDAVAVIDLGKTNLKLMLIDAEGRILADERADNRPVAGPPYLHVDTDRVWHWILGALKLLSGRARVRAIVPCTYGSTAALVDDGGALALPIMDYEADPPDAVKDAYAAIAPPFAEVFAPINPGGLTLARQFTWQETAFDDAFARTRLILPYAQYWAWRLCGVAAAEVTLLGAQTHLWAPKTGDFASIAKDRGWAALFPPLRAPWDVLGTIRPDLAAATGLAPDVSVLCGIHDSNANFLRYRAAGLDDVTLMSTGTWLINFNAAYPLDRLAPERDTAANVDATGRPVACSRFMIGREYGALAGPRGTPDPTAGDIADLIAAGTMALPSFSDSGGPFPGTGGKGRIDGPPPETATARTALATLYAALMSSVAIDLIGSTGPVAIDGGFAANAPYGRLVAALRPGQEVRASTAAEGTALGAALLWGWAERTEPARLDLTAVEPFGISGLTAYAAEWRRRAEALVAMG